MEAGYKNVTPRPPIRSQNASMTSKTSKTTPQRGTILTIGAEEPPNKVMEPSHDVTPCLVTRVQSGIPNWDFGLGLRVATGRAGATGLA
jgi:hypothetical protein